MGRLQRSEIVNEGMERSGQTGIETRCNFFLNQFLEHLYRRQDWPFLLKTATVSSGSSDDELDISGLSPEYLNVKTVLVTTDDIGTLAHAAESGLSYEDLWELKEEALFNSNTGTPTDYHPAPDKQTILVYPKPDKAITAKIRYYGLPAAIDTSSSGDSTVPDWPDDEGLVRAVEAFSNRYEHDRGWQIVHQMTEQAVARVRASIADRGRRGPARLRWGRGFNKVTNK